MRLPEAHRHDVGIGPDDPLHNGAEVALLDRYGDRFGLREAIGLGLLHDLLAGQHRAGYFESDANRALGLRTDLACQISANGAGQR